MFTNWLTNSVVPTTMPSTITAAAATSTDVASVNLAENSHAMANAALAANSASSLMSTPPDVILEVGTSPSSVRFVAHSIVLGMHSGYLRSAIRLDEQVTSGGGHSSADLVLYLSNVSADQFAPLLTYMYTGYLDLNVENIFGVLLATHLLHMPRALEICRSFLARAQSEGYLSSSALPGVPSAQQNGKIIRPIPSKATLPNFGFIAPPMSHHLAAALPPPPPPPVAYKTLPHTNSYQTVPPTTGSTSQQPILLAENNTGQENLQLENRANNNINGGADDNDDDDEEVFIDCHDESDTASPEIDCNISVASSKDCEGEKEIVVVVTEESNASSARLEKSTTQMQKTKTLSAAATNATAKREKLRNSRHHHKQHRRSGGSSKTILTSTGGLQVAKAPILASELIDQERTVTATTAAATESSKVIIDVACCDGPVRFRRILNTAYGHKPPPASENGDGNLMPPMERSQQSVSLSFHQQMAKAISQQRQLQHAEESENSESSGSGCGGLGGAVGAGAVSNSKHNGASKSGSSNEIYVCVYCKHSFKSQYCYQKHAKRHLNPLSLSCGNALESSSTICGGGGDGNRIHSKEVARESVGAATALRQSQADSAATTSAGSAYHQTVLPPHVAHKQHAAAAELLRREVRPLDMNVQYYPCKTCGSKFPSYYFVHKHRKLCHADEEAHEAEDRRSSGGGGGSGGGGSGTAHKKIV